MNRIFILSTLLCMLQLICPFNYEAKAEWKTATQWSQQSLELKERAHKFRSAAERCRQRIASGELETCKVENRDTGEFMSIGEAEAYATELESQSNRLCDKVKEQLERDIEVIKKYEKSRELGLKELSEWERANKEAEKAALMAGMSVIMGRFADNLTKREASARAFKGWLTRYKKQLVEDGVPFSALYPKIERAMNGYLVAKTNAASGKILQKGLEINKHYGLFKKEVSAIALSTAKNDKLVREVIQDPRIQKYLEKDSPEIDVSYFIAEKSGEEIATIIVGTNLPVKLADFIISYSYEAVKWNESRKRIMQQYDIRDQELLAYKSTGEQIKKTAAALKRCRGK